MVADEGRFGRLGQVMSAWCGSGIRPAGGQQLVREYFYSFVAVAPVLGSMTALVLPFSNTEMMNLFLAQVAEEFIDYFVVMQVDGASLPYRTGFGCSREHSIDCSIPSFPARCNAPTIGKLMMQLGIKAACTKVAIGAKAG